MIAFFISNLPSCFVRQILSVSAEGGFLGSRSGIRISRPAPPPPVPPGSVDRRMDAARALFASANSHAALQMRMRRMNEVMMSSSRPDATVSRLFPYFLWHARGRGVSLRASREDERPEHRRQSLWTQDVGSARTVKRFGRPRLARCPSSQRPSIRTDAGFGG